VDLNEAAGQYGAPVLAVCGFSGSGKTTLLETAIPKLVGRGLAVAVVKHDAHGFEVDKPGKDSDRLFRAGAAVALRGPQQQFERRGAKAILSLETTLARLACDHDLLLVEGHKDTPLPKLWLKSAEQVEVPESVTNVAQVLEWDRDRSAALMEYIDRWLPTAWNARPLYRGLLIGGASSRMGSPKQMVLFGGRMLGEIAAEALGGIGSEGNSRIVVLGAGLLPESLKTLGQLPDAPNFAGPGAALIAAHRWAPGAAWIVAACDHPWLAPEHIAWLAAQRQPGRWAVIPKQSDGHPCPTLALYEPQALEYIARQAQSGGSRDARAAVLLDLPRTAIVMPPAEFAKGWDNVNTRQELRAEEEQLPRRQQSEVTGRKG